LFRAGVMRRVQVKGRKQEFMLYELLGMARRGDPELETRPADRTLSGMTWIASKSFETGEFACANFGFKRSTSIIELLVSFRFRSSRLARCKV